MIAYLDMPIERINAAMDTFLAHDGSDFAARVNERQWTKVEKGEADMDAAFVIAVEEEAALETA